MTAGRTLFNTLFNCRTGQFIFIFGTGDQFLCMTGEQRTVVWDVALCGTNSIVPLPSHSPITHQCPKGVVSSIKAHNFHLVYISTPPALLLCKLGTARYCTSPSTEGNLPVVYSDGSCLNNGCFGAKAGIGVFWSDGSAQYVTTTELGGVVYILACLIWCG